MIKNLDKIKDSADAIAIIGRYVELKKSGSNYSGCCPFHEEKSPSFVVSPRKQNYVCYGCGKQGDLLKFLMELKKMTFVEAVEDIAKTGNMAVEYDRSRTETQEVYEKKKQDRDDLYIIFNKALTLLVPVQKELYPEIELDGRVYSRQTAENFLLGYHVPKAIFNGRERAGISIEDAIKAGLLKASQKHDGHYEVFANRSLYPIQDAAGRVVGFGGRKQPDAKKEAPKYINSEESPVYQKSKTLYGLYQAQQSITKLDRAIIVEGYTDVLTLSDNGIKNVVATCGTSVTTEHAWAIGKYADNVTLLLDGDSAGLAASARAVEILIDRTLNVFVALLPIEEPTPGNIVKIDPDEYVRKFGPDALREILENAQDGVIWSVMAQWDKNDMQRQLSAIKTAARLLSCMDSTKRAIYIKKLTDRAHMGNVKKELEEEIDVCMVASAPENLWNSTEQDAITKYGVYEARNCYYVPSGEPGKGSALSNFSIKSMTLVVGNRESERIIEIAHVTGHVMQARIESEVFTNYTAFEQWIESKGQYYFHEGASKLWNKIRRFVVDKMLTVFPVTKLGWHREGFWVWRKGITSCGQYIPVGPGGIVTHEGVHYMLTMAVDLVNTKSDDVGRSAITQYFCYSDLMKKPDFQYFGKLMQKAYGNKSVVGLAYVIAALFRDIVWENEDYFPMFNIFGMPGSGKNKYFEILIALWGAGGRFIDLTNTTEKALPRFFAQSSNGVVWLDEYRNELSDDMLSILTNAYNGAGRSMADYTGGTETKTFDVTSAVMISGEHRPTRRMALYTRCIAQETLTANFDDETTDAYEKVREISRTGSLTLVLSELLRYRSNIQQDFADTFKQERNTLKMSLSGQKIEDRLVGNYAVICAISSTLQQHGFGLPFNLDVLRDECYKGILHQSRVIGSEDPISSFWRIIAFLYESKYVQHGTDIIIEDATSVRIVGKKDAETTERVFEDPKRLLFLRLQKAHGLYLEYFQKQFKGQGLALGTLEHYLFTNTAYIGTCRAKKFGQATLRAHVFDLGKIPVEFRIDNIAVKEADVF